MPSFNLGELDTLVQLQSNRTTTGAVGQVISTWVDEGSVWAKAERSADEGVNEGNYGVDQSIRLTVYKNPRLSTRWRVIVHSRPYEIRSIDMGQRTDLTCVLQLAALDER